MIKEYYPIVITLTVAILAAFAMNLIYKYQKFNLDRVVIQSAVERNVDTVAVACAMQIDSANPTCDRYLVTYKAK
jgi:hypothetical protein